jgi:predicted CoA-binding protein
MRDETRCAMPSEYETFWNAKSYAVVGHTEKSAFPLFTYKGLKKSGRVVYPVDPKADVVDGDRAYPDLASLPASVEAVVIEVPKEETREWIAQAADAGIKDVWVHQTRDTPLAVALAAERGLRLRTGTCAAMYATPGLSFHSIHKLIQIMRGKF